MSPPPEPALVFVVDDDESVRDALARQIALLGYRVECFSAPEDVLVRVESRLGDCLLVDLVMPGMNGLELQSALAGRGCTMPTIFLSGRGDIPSTVEAIRTGALDFLEKPVESERLHVAIASAVARSAADAERGRARAEAQRRLVSLTDRQRQVFDHVVAGAPNKVIAFRLGVTLRTVKAHRQQVMEKLGARSVADLAYMARDLGIDPAAADTPAARPPARS
jgi:FixJ family two-component response regulator